MATLIVMTEGSRAGVGIVMIDRVTTRVIGAAIAIATAIMAVTVTTISTVIAVMATVVMARRWLWQQRLRSE